MKVDINIGLNVDGEAPTLQKYYGRIETIVKAFKQAGYRIEPKAAGVWESNTEPTMVIRIEGTILLGALKVFLYDLSEKLKQDCIAVKPEGLDGFLVGPRAAAWGKFDPDQFIGPDGTTAQPKADKEVSPEEYTGLVDADIKAIIKEQSTILLAQLEETGGDYNQIELFIRVARAVETLTVMRVANIVGFDAVVF